MFFDRKDVWSRLADIPNRSGQFGSLLSSLAALGWLAAMIFDPGVPRYSSSLILALSFAPRVSIMIWLACVAVLPIGGIAFNLTCLRAVASHMALCLWAYMLLSAIVLAPPDQFPSGIGIYGALFIACLNAEARFWISVLT